MLRSDHSKAEMIDACKPDIQLRRCEIYHGCLSPKETFYHFKRVEVPRVYNRTIVRNPSPSFSIQILGILNRLLARAD
jgi:hypothetical protein